MLFKLCSSRYALQATCFKASSLSKLSKLFMQSSLFSYTVEINSSVDCSSRNIIYLLGCKRCPNQYIGESERSLKERFFEHKGYVTNNMVTKATGLHFNERGHSVSDMEITVLEKLFNDNPHYRKQREKMLINKFCTFG